MPTIVETLSAAEKLHAAGNLVEAERQYREVLKADPRHALAWHNLGLLVHQCGNWAAAIECLSRAIKLDGSRAMFHNNLGAVLQSRAQLPDAVACYTRAIALKSDYAEAHCNLGSAYKDQKRTDAAIDCYRHALDLNPKLAEAHFNLGVIYQEDDQLDRAAQCYENATRLKSGYWQALTNQGTVYKLLGRYDEALACCDAAIAAGGDVAEAHRNRALLRLQLGDYAEGWPEYEWRFRVKGAPKSTIKQPRWDGNKGNHGALLLKTEQGLGDAIQFIRFAPLARQRFGGEVLLHCPESMRSLLSTAAGIDRFAAEDLGQETFDCYAPLMSLPAILGTTVETIPAAVPYLSAEPKRVEQWQPVLDGDNARYKVGIAWQGNPDYKADRHRSVPLENFASLAACPGVRLVNLQKCHGLEQLASLGDRLPIIDLGPGLDADGAFLDTAAVMMSLDLVITSDTAIAHLAGALGVNVWVALAYVPDWRWLIERPDSPWYPTMRLFRQNTSGDWGEVFERIAADLQRRLSERGDSGQGTANSRA